VLSVAAVLAGTVTEAGVDNDGVSRDDTGHFRSHRLDDPCPIRPNYPGGHEAHARQPLDEPEVEVIERGRPHANPDVGRAAKLRLGKIRPKRDVLEAAMCGKCQSSQTVASTG
jgi:hypothetical protein